MLNLLLASAWLASSLTAAAAPLLNEPVGQPYAPDFSQPLGREWSVIKGQWQTVNGELRGDELPADKHAAVLHHPGKVEALILTCEFRLGEARTLYFGFDGQRHVGRLVVRPNGTGLYEDGPDTKGKSVSKPLATAEVKPKPGEWYPLTLEIRSDEMVAQLLGKTLKARHAYLATPKARYWLAVSGTNARVRNLKVWDARPNPAWQASGTK